MVLPQTTKTITSTSAVYQRLAAFSWKCWLNIDQPSKRWECIRYYGTPSYSWMFYDTSMGGHPLDCISKFIFKRWSPMLRLLSGSSDGTKDSLCGWETVLYIICLFNGTGQHLPSSGATEWERWDEIIGFKQHRDIWAAGTDGIDGMFEQVLLKLMRLKNR